MTHVEKMRFQAALQTLRGTCPLSTETEPAVDARGVQKRRARRRQGQSREPINSRSMRSMQCGGLRDVLRSTLKSHLAL